ncbi:MAG TPA: hypothetical protein VIF62_11150 [Labilithrix sp.]
MRRGTLRYSASTVAIAIALVACGSSGSSDDPNAPGTNNPTGQNPDPNAAQNQPQTPEQQVKEILDARKVDYGEAARTAKLKLTDTLPTMDEINKIASAPDDASKKVAYEALIDGWIASPAFASTMVKYFRDTYKTGQVGTVQMGKPNMDEAALFSAQVVVEGRSFTEILTANANTCPTLDSTMGTFTAASCNTNPTVGVLTDPGIQAQYYSNMAFRRTRFVQETFACQKFPAEFADSSKVVPMGNGTYTNPWDFNRVIGKKNTPTARIDFQDTSAVICANCHGTLNGIAPLFVNYDMNGALQTSSQVEVPIPGNPKADAAKDYLFAGQPLAWRFNVPITDIPSLGAAMAADATVQTCAVNRVWNYAMSRGDIVNDLATVPADVTAPFVKDFTSNGQKLKETIRAVFKADDFVKF